MQRFFICFSYDGSAYHGWQIQPGDLSVQEVMTERMCRLFGPDFSLVGAGRTDAGVHASCMWAHFDLTDAQVEKYCQKDGALCASLLKDKLDRMMPADIRVREVRPVRADAHARFDAVSRTYEYRFALTRNPFLRHYATFLPSLPDVEAMNRAAAILPDYTDFTSFSKLHTDTKTNDCQVSEARWDFRRSEFCQDEEPDLLVFTVRANRFLRNMVRALTGTLLEVGRGQLDEDGFRRVLELKDRCEAGQSMPPQGLFLTDVSYPEQLFES